MKNYQRLSVLALTLIMGTGNSKKTTLSSQGYSIAQKSQQVSFAYQTLKVSAAMTLYKGEQQSGTRAFKLNTIEIMDRGHFDKARINVTSPKSLDGIVLLSWSSADGKEQQWIHTPRIRQTRRIGDNSRKAKFINSNFTYEDLLRWQVDNYEYEYLKTEHYNNERCQVVQAIPKKTYSNYSKLITWYDPLFRIVRIDYYDKHGALKKQLYQQEYELFLDKYWQPKKSQVIDVQNKTKTVIQWSGFQFDTTMPSIFFDSTQLSD